MTHARYALYHLPSPGALADFGAAWLGWDVQAGGPVAQPDLPGLDEITATPRKYGLHGTLKPPFRLAETAHVAALCDAVAQLAASCAPAQSDGLELSRLGRFLALTPVGDDAGIARIAARCVTEIDAFRAPMSAAELARRRKPGLTARQAELLERWGYPHVLDAFRFHLTLTGRLPKAEIALWRAQIASRLPPLPAPFVLDQIALVGERPDGGFALIRRFELTG